MSTRFLAHPAALITSCLALFAAVAPGQCTLIAPGTQITPTPVDDWTAAIPLGLAFPFKGTTYNGMYVSDHGLVALHNNGVPSVPPGSSFLWNPSPTNLTGMSPILAPYWSDHTPGTSGSLYVDNTSGSQCTITWVDHATYPQQLPLFSVQLTLYATGVIAMRLDCRVSNQGSTFGALNAIVGIGRPGSALPAASDLSSVLSTANAVVFEEFTTTGAGVPNPLFDLEHTTLTFTDLGPGNGWAITRGLYPPGPTSLQGDDSPRLVYYGSASGAETSAGLDVFGLPAGGETLQLRLRNSRPNVFAAFLVGFAPTAAAVPGIGTLLAEPTGSLVLLTLTDPLGQATVPIAIPTMPAYGQELFAQALTLDWAQTFGLSGATAFAIGANPDPVPTTTHLEGTIGVTGGTTVPASGVITALVQHGASAGQLDGSLTFHTAALDTVQFGVLVQNLRIAIATAPGLVWGASTIYTTPQNSPASFRVGYGVAGQQYGAFTIHGAYRVTPGSLTTSPIMLPAHAGPLSGRSLTLDLLQRRLDGGHFTQLALVPVPPDGVAHGAALTPADVAQQFAASQAWTGALLAAHSGDTSFFSSSMPTYSQFVAHEAVNLSGMTCGLATDVAGLHTLIAGGVVGLDEGWAALFGAKLLAALGEALGAEAAHAFHEVLLDVCRAEMNELGEHVAAGRFRAATKVMSRMLPHILSQPFLEKLTARIGAELAERIAFKIGSKCIPVIGWGIFAWDVGSAIVEQWL